MNKDEIKLIKFLIMIPIVFILLYAFAWTSIITKLETFFFGKKATNSELGGSDIIIIIVAIVILFVIIRCIIKHLKKKKEQVSQVSIEDSDFNQENTVIKNADLHTDKINSDNISNTKNEYNAEDAMFIGGKKVYVYNEAKKEPNILMKLIYKLGMFLGIIVIVLLTLFVAYKIEPLRNVLNIIYNEIKKLCIDTAIFLAILIVIVFNFISLIISHFNQRE